MGVDLVSVARVEEALARTPTLRDRLFTAVERDLPPESLAARFAAKEALAKALGAPEGLSWQEASVVGRPPTFTLSGRVAELVGSARVHLSLSHDAGLATAYVVLESP